MIPAKNEVIIMCSQWNTLNYKFVTSGIRRIFCTNPKTIRNGLRYFIFILVW